ncbi:hypothetical protein FEP54_03763 [Burkholderia multivorans]|nr:hypothetical protein [Burkholderia multivorans]
MPGSGAAAPEAATGTTAAGGAAGDVQAALNATSAMAAISVHGREDGRSRSNMEPSAAMKSKEAAGALLSPRGAPIVIRQEP